MSLRLLRPAWGVLGPVAIALVACGGSAPASQPAAARPTVTVTLSPSPTASAPATEPSPTPPASPTPAPLPTVEPSPTPQPSATPDDAHGAPCPATPPDVPDYLAYTLTAGAWPTPDPAAPPPLILRDPLPGALRNEGYPYGSDGSGRYLLHNGLDTADEGGALAVAPADGMVIVARDDLGELFGWRCDWYGQVVILRLDETWAGQPVYVLFGHVSDVQVTEGQRVAAGDPVARQGTAGAANVAHLHVEVRVGANDFGATRNPLLWLRPEEGAGIVAGRLVAPDGRAWQGVTVTLIDAEGNLRNTWTYLDDPRHLISPEPLLGENFVFAPVAAGQYDVFTQVAGTDYRQTIEVREGETTTLEIKIGD